MQIPANRIVSGLAAVALVAAFTSVVANETQADTVLVKLPYFLVQRTHEQVHQAVDLGFGPPPVFT